MFRASASLPLLTLLIITLMQVVVANRPGPRPGRPNGFSQTQCYTIRGDSSVSSVPTATRTFTATYTYTKIRKAWPKTTVTPDTSITTTTSTINVDTSVTLSQHTDTAYEYSTELEATTITASPSTVVELTTTYTETTLTSTTTVAAPANFRPIQDTLPGSRANKKRDLRLLARAKTAMNDSALNFSEIVTGTPARYPKRVMCNVFLNVPATTLSTKTLPLKTLTAATPLSTRVISSTETATQTIYPSDASTTLTLTSTSTSSQTVTPIITTTSIVTSTETIQAPMATFYAQCGANNFASSGQSGGGLNALALGGEDSQYIRGLDAYNCCVQCLKSPGCVVGISYYGDNCNVVTTRSATCPASKNTYKIRQGLSSSPITYFNGVCGEINTYY